MSKYFNVPVVLQILGVVVFGLTIWKGVHGFFPTFGLIAGALLLYIGKHYAKVYDTASAAASSIYPYLLVLIALGLVACGAKKPVRANVVIPRHCLESVQLTDKTECTAPDGGKLTCSPVLVERQTGCETLRVDK